MTHPPRWVAGAVAALGGLAVVCLNARTVPQLWAGAGIALFAGTLIYQGTP